MTSADTTPSTHTTFPVLMDKAVVPSTIVPPFRSTATASPLTILPGSTTAEGAKKIPECTLEAFT